MAPPRHPLAAAADESVWQEGLSLTKLMQRTHAGTGEGRIEQEVKTSRGGGDLTHTAALIFQAWLSSLGPLPS